MQFYHRTLSADAILRGGFSDGTGYYMTDSEHTGVFLSDVPLNVADGAPEGSVLLVVEIAEELARP